MASAFERFKASVQRLLFAGLRPDEPAMPGPTSVAKRIWTAVGVLVIAASVWVLVLVLRHPAEQPEKVTTPRFVEIIPKGFQVEKNKDVEVVEIEFKPDRLPKEITGTLRNLTDRPFARCEIS